MTSRLFALTSFAFAVLLLSCALPSPALAQRIEVRDMRDMQALIAAERSELRTQAEWLQQLLDERRTVFVTVPLEGFDGYAMVTEKDAVAAWTLDYLQNIARTGKPFSTDDLAAYMKMRRDTARDLAANLTGTIAALNDRAAKLDAEWKRLETQIAELTLPATAATPAAPGSGKKTGISDADRVCVDLAETHPSAKPLSEAAAISPGTAVHTATDGGMRGRNPLDLMLSWTAPPLRLCSGDTFEIEMTASNRAATFEDNGINFVAKISASSSRLSLVSCSNPATWMDSKSESAAILVPTRSSYTNTCTYQVGELVASQTPRSFLQVSLATLGERGAGEILYLYAAQ